MAKGHKPIHVRKLSAIMNPSQSNTMTARMVRGFSYEQQVRNYIAVQPGTQQAFLWRVAPERVMEEAGIIKDFDKQRIKRRQLWDQAENNVRDTGVDILVKTTTDNFELIQAKNYAEEKVKQGHLAGFYRQMISFDLPGSVYSNSAYDPLLLLDDCDRLKYFRFDYLEPTSQDQKVTEKNLVLRDYQIDAIEKLTLHFQVANRAVLSLICGTGKTVVAAHVSSSYDNVIVFSPFCAHAKQNLRRFQDILPNHHQILVDSDGTRDLEEISNKLSRQQKNIVSSTFMSADIICDVLSRLDCRKTLIVTDEFHNLTMSDVVNRGSCFYQIMSSNFKILFLSATPRVFQLEDSSQEDNDLSAFFGDFQISMSLKDAIERRFITDYRIFIPLISEVGDEAKCKDELGINDIDESLLSRGLFLIKCMLYEGAKKTIVYLQTNKELESFYGILSHVSRDYFEIKDLWVGRIVSETSAIERGGHLDRFQSHEGYAILLNIRILGECIDIPAADSVYFANSCKSKIAAVQRLCRANRLNPRDPDKVAKIFLWADADNDLTQFCASIKEIDPQFPSKLNVVSRKYEKRTSSVTHLESAQLERQRAFAIGVQEYIGNNEERAKLKAQQYVDFCQKEGRHPIQHADDPDERKLAEWMNNYKQGIKGNHHVKERPAVNDILSQLKHGSDSRAAAADNKIQEIQRSIDENGKVPSGNTNPLSQFLSRQRKFARGEEVKGGHAPYVAQMDEAFGDVWRNEDDTDWNERVKAEGFIKRVWQDYGGLKPPSKRGMGQASTDYNYLADYRAKMKYGKTAKKSNKVIRPDMVRFLRERLPDGMLPPPEECLEEYR